MDIFCKTIVNLHNFYSLNLSKLLSGGVGRSSRTVNERQIKILSSRTISHICCIFVRIIFIFSDYFPFYPFIISPLPFHWALNSKLLDWEIHIQRTWQWMTMNYLARSNTHQVLDTISQGYYRDTFKGCFRKHLFYEPGLKTSTWVTV